MNARSDTERILDAFLAPEADRLPDRVIDAALDDIARTPQRRALRVPWRFRYMPSLSRVTAVAAVALVLAVGAGGLVYLNSPGGPGGAPAPTPTPIQTPTPAPTATPAASEVAPGIPGWTTYTSAVYGFTIAYPSDWSLAAAAEHKWQPNEPAVPDSWPWADVFGSPDGDGQIGMWVWQAPAPAASDLNTWEGLQAAFMAVCEVPSFGSCEFERVTTDSPPTRMCLGRPECRPALVVSMGIEEVEPWGVFGDAATGRLTVFQMGRPDDFPGAAKYGGTVALLKAILTQLDVRSPQPGETPH
jgi:hypothetical protein